MVFGGALGEMCPAVKALPCSDAWEKLFPDKYL